MALIPCEMTEEKNTFLYLMDELHSIETPIYIYKIMEQKENKKKCKRNEDNVQKR